MRRHEKDAQTAYAPGMPFFRIEKLQGGMGIPLPAATQWELVEGAAVLLELLKAALPS